MSIPSSSPPQQVYLPEFWESYQDRILAYIRKRIPDLETAKDIRQIVLLKVFENYQKADSVRNPISWLFQIAHNAVMDHFRQQKREQKMASGWQEVASVEETEFLQREAANCIRPLLKGIPDKYAQPLLWADLEGISQQEVADRLGISLSGAKSRVQRAREKLKALMLECCHVSLNQQGQLLHFVPRADCSLFQEGCGNG